MIHVAVWIASALFLVVIVGICLSGVVQVAVFASDLKKDGRARKEQQKAEAMDREDRRRVRGKYAPYVKVLDVTSNRSSTSLSLRS